MQRNSILWLIVFLTSGTLLCQTPPGNRKDLGELALDRRIPEVTVEHGSMLDGIAALAEESPELAFSFENVLKPTFQAERPIEARFDVREQDHTAREILQEFCARDVRFSWSRDGSTINIFPAASKNDPAYFLNRRFGAVQLKDVRDAQEALFAAIKQLPAPFEQIAVSQAGGDISFSAPWTVSFSNLTVRELLNRIAQHVSPRTGWIFGGSQDFRTVTFYTGRLHRMAQ